MAISDKTRKILWARSGNRCAICRIVLVVDRTDSDAESVIGEEAHIVSGAPNGPRYDSHFPIEYIDDLDNLILLCGVHHKQIDDQCVSNPADVVRGKKQEHENWVKATLSSSTGEIRPRVRRIKQNIPEKLPIVTSGKHLLELLAGSYGVYQDYEEDLSDEETELVGGFLQELMDWADVSDVLEPLDVLRTTNRLNRCIKELDTAGFFVFAGTEMQRLEGGKEGPENWPVRHVLVLRKTNPRVVVSERKSETPRANKSGCVRD